MADYTVIGHIAVDRVISAYEDRVQIGGSPTYASLAARGMGGKIEAITKVGSDISEDHISQLKRIGLDIREDIVKDATTTKFVLDYRIPERRLKVEGVCVDIIPSDVVDATVAVLLSPIVGEIPQQTYSRIDAEVLALDPRDSSGRSSGMEPSNIGRGTTRTCSRGRRYSSHRNGSCG